MPRSSTSGKLSPLEKSLTPSARTVLRTLRPNATELQAPAVQPAERQRARLRLLQARVRASAVALAAAPPVAPVRRGSDRHVRAVAENPLTRAERSLTRSATMP